jgi:hypothetical protein
MDWPNSPVACRAYSSGSQNISTGGGATTITFDSEDYDTADMHSLVTNTGRITVPVTGYYLCVGQITYAAIATGQRQARLHKNGTLFAQTTQGDLGGVPNVAMQVSEVVKLTAGDYVELTAFQTSGSTNALVAPANPLSLSVTLLGTL